MGCAKCSGKECSADRPQRERRGWTWAKVGTTSLELRSTMARTTDLPVAPVVDGVEGVDVAERVAETPRSVQSAMREEPRLNGQMPRHARDAKYSLGGGGRRSKQNTKESSNDFAGWSGDSKGKGGRGGKSGGAQRGGKNRPGKSRRSGGRR